MEIIVGGLIEKDGKFLLVQEAKKKCYGKWNIPAGHLDNNETIFEGAIREVFEETGFEIEITGILQIGNKKFIDRKFVLMIFSSAIISGEISYDKSEILDVKWFTYEEILNMKDNLRDPVLIVNAVKAYIDNKIVSLDLIEIMD